MQNLQTQDKIHWQVHAVTVRLLQVFKRNIKINKWNLFNEWKRQFPSTLTEIFMYGKDYIARKKKKRIHTRNISGVNMTRPGCEE